MYALMGINASFLTLAIYGHVPRTRSAGAAIAFCLSFVVRAEIWATRSDRVHDIARITRYIVRPFAASELLVAAFGA